MFGKEFRFSFKFCSGPDNKTTKQINRYNKLDKIYQTLNNRTLNNGTFNNNKTWVKRYSNGGMIKYYIIVDITITIKTLQIKIFDDNFHCLIISIN